MADQRQDPAAGAARALQRFRERSGGTAECLIGKARSLQKDASRRRLELVEREVEEGRVARELAEEVYDLAREEGLDPLFAFALVECGVAIVIEPDEPDAPAVSDRAPEWIHPAHLERDDRERRLRRTFRRLRSLLERSATPEDALAAFAAEPDVGHIDLRREERG
jgi:hypothetical protein